MSPRPLPTRITLWRFISVNPLELGITVGAFGALLALTAQRQDWTWFVPAYKVAVAVIVLVLAADRSQGEPLGRHRTWQGLALWTGVALAAGTLFYNAVLLMLAVVHTDSELVVMALVAGMFILANAAVSVSELLREHRDSVTTDESSTEDTTDG